MKLRSRVRARAKVYEMEPESGYLLLFKNKKNAHLYTRAGSHPYREGADEFTTSTIAREAQKNSPKSNRNTRRSKRSRREIQKTSSVHGDLIGRKRKTSPRRRGSGVLPRRGEISETTRQYELWAKLSKITLAYLQ